MTDTQANHTLVLIDFIQEKFTVDQVDPNVVESMKVLLVDAYIALMVL